MQRKPGISLRQAKEVRTPARYVVPHPICLLKICLAFSLLRPIRVRIQRSTASREASHSVTPIPSSWELFRFCGRGCFRAAVEWAKGPVVPHTAPEPSPHVFCGTGPPGQRHRLCCLMGLAAGSNRLRGPGSPCVWCVDLISRMSSLGSANRGQRGLCLCPQTILVHVPFLLPLLPFFDPLSLLPPSSVLVCWHSHVQSPNTYLPLSLPVLRAEPLGLGPCWVQRFRTR